MTFPVRDRAEIVWLNDRQLEDLAAGLEADLVRSAAGRLLLRPGDVQLLAEVRWELFVRAVFDQA